MEIQRDYSPFPGVNPSASTPAALQRPSEVFVLQLLSIGTETLHNIAVLV